MFAVSILCFSFGLQKTGASIQVRRETGLVCVHALVIMLCFVSMTTPQVAGETLPNSTERAVTISGRERAWQ